MSLKQARYFVAVAEELHFGKAAARLHVVQPAISQQIRLLEIELGLQLLQRSSRRVALTDAGKAYLVEARRALQHFEFAAEAAHAAAGGLGGALNIGFVDNALWSCLPRMIKTFRARYPNVDLTLTQMPRSSQFDALQSQGIDVGILPGPASSEHLRVGELAREPVCVVLPQGHPLCAGTEVEMRDLANETFIAIPSAINPRRINDIVLEMCAKAGFTPSFGQPVHQLQTAISLVSAGLGVAVVPPWMRRAWIEDVEFRTLTPHSDYVLLLATTRAHDRPVVQTFLSVAKDFVIADGHKPVEGPFNDHDE